MNINKTIFSVMNNISPPINITLIKKGACVWINREPTYNETTVELTGKIQPANKVEIAKMGYNVMTSQYYNFWFNFEVETINLIKQLGADYIKAEGLIYKICNREDFIRSGWRSCLAVVVDNYTEEL